MYDAVSGAPRMRDEPLAQSGVYAVIALGFDVAHENGDLLLRLVEALLQRSEQLHAPLVTLDALLELELIALERADDFRELVQSLLEAEIFDVG